MISITQTLLVAAGLAAQALAHSCLVSPAGRLHEKFGFGTSLEDGSGDRRCLCNLENGNPVCCSSEVMKHQKSYKRGDEVEASWWRNNHQGGFIRWSIVPQDQVSQDAFDSAENVLSYQCNQVGCDATYDGSGPNNWDGADKNGFMEWSNMCSGGFKIPYHLKDGAYTVQWIWFGEGDDNNGAMTANSPFQGCVDLQIKGGKTGDKPDCPLFKGGDLSESGDDVCAYVAVDKPTLDGVCRDSNKCSGRPAVGIPAGLDQCIAGKAPKSYPLGMVQSAKGAPDTYTDFSPSGSGPSKGKKYAVETESSTTPASVDEGNDSTPSEGSSSSAATEEVADSAYEAPKSKKKCSNKKRRSMLVKSSAKRHRRRSAAQGGARAARHVRSNLKGAIAL